jgi:hypothetical protein
MVWRRGEGEGSRFSGTVRRFIGALILSHRFIVVNGTKMAGLRALEVVEGLGSAS